MLMTHAVEPGGRTGPVAAGPSTAATPVADDLAGKSRRAAATAVVRDTPRAAPRRSAGAGSTPRTASVPSTPSRAVAKSRAAWPDAFSGKPAPVKSGSDVEIEVDEADLAMLEESAVACDEDGSRNEGDDLPDVFDEDLTEDGEEEARDADPLAVTDPEHLGSDDDGEDGTSDNADGVPHAGGGAETT